MGHRREFFENVRTFTIAGAGNALDFCNECADELLETGILLNSGLGRQLCVGILDTRFRLVYVNDALCEWFDARACDLLGQSVVWLSPPECRERRAGIFKHVLEDGEDVTFDSPSTHGNTIRITLHPLLNGFGRVLAIVGMFWVTTRQFVEVGMSESPMVIE